MRHSSSTSSSKWIGKFFLTLAILFCVTLAAGFLIDALHGKERQSWRVQDDMIADFYAQKADSCDLLFFGSSHIMCTVIPEIFDDRSPGIRSFNLGASSQLPDTTYHLLREGLSRQHPDYVVIDLFYTFLQKEHDASQSELIFKPMPLCAEKVRMFFDLFTWEEQKKLLKTWLNPWYRLTKAGLYQGELYLGEVAEAVDRSGVYIDRGFYTLGDRVLDVAEMNSTYANSPEAYAALSETQTEYVRKMATACADADVKLVFISIPMAPSYRTINPNYEANAAQVSALCSELGVPYYDFNEADLFSLTGLTDADYADRAHTNQAGAEKFTRFLADFLSEKGFFAH